MAERTDARCRSSGILHAGQAMLPTAMPRLPLAALLLALALALLPASTRADGPPATQAAILSCTAAIEGAVACMAEKLCLCRFDPGGTLTGRPPGVRWDCGIDRPSCGGPVPADLGGFPGGVPIAPVQPQLLIPWQAPPGPSPGPPWGPPWGPPLVPPHGPPLGPHPWR
jgi:hypothetical protein